MDSPLGSTEYSFKLPDNWLVNEGSYLDFEFSYVFTDLGGGDQEAQPILLGELSIYVDDRLLEAYSLNEPSLEHAHLPIDLPPDLFNERLGSYHEVKVALDAWFLCNTSHEAQLTIHPESSLFLDYTLLPPTVDLDVYPVPFYQRSFEPDQVRLVLPVQPSEADLHAAAAVAAGLGDLTGNRVLISATTDVDWLNMLDAGQSSAEHLFVVGQPERNQLITWLNDNAALPIPLRRRELALGMEGPTVVMPGDVFSYTLTVTNTTSLSFASLSLVDQLPRQAGLLSCHPQCTEIEGREVAWSLSSLSPGEVASFSLVLQLASTTQLSSHSPVLENIAVLIDEAQSPLNIRSLNIAVGSSPTEEEFVTESAPGDYFFTQNGQPVPEGDGILQEIVSPWDPQHVILLVTGVNEDAILKASQSLGVKTRFPGMRGPAARVQEFRASSPITTVLATDFYLGELGPTNPTVYGPYPPHSHQIPYRFYVPVGWHRSNDAYLHLFFSHSGVIDPQDSTLTVLLNGAPLATVNLDQENATGGDLQVDLPNSSIRRGIRNTVAVQVQMQLNRDRCEDVNFDQAWLSISQNSFLHMDQQIEETTVFDLDDFPFPFGNQPDLSDVLFVLPPAPGPVEQEALLHLASVLGGAASEAARGPAVSLGGELDDEALNRYHIVAIGRPTNNPLIQQVNSLLPQPFIAGTDEVEYRVDNVLLRLSPDISLGYVQEISSPWDEHKAFIAVTGTTDKGVEWAGYALAHRSWRLSGNLALVREEEGEVDIQSIDTRKLVSSGLNSTIATSVPELAPAEATRTPIAGADTRGLDTPTQPTSLPGTAEDKRELPIWVVLVAGATLVIVLAIFGIALWQFRRRQGQKIQ